MTANVWELTTVTRERYERNYLTRALAVVFLMPEIEVAFLVRSPRVSLARSLFPKMRNKTFVHSYYNDVTN